MKATHLRLGGGWEGGGGDKENPEEFTLTVSLSICDLV